MDPLGIIMVQNTAAAVFALVSRKLAPKLPHSFFQFAAITLAAELLLGIVLALFVGGVHVADLWRWLPLLLAGGVAFAVTNALSFKVFQYVDAAVASLLSTFNIIAAILIGTIVIGEGLNAHTGIGAMVIIAASWIVLSAHVNVQERRAWTVGLGLSLAAAVFFGAATVNEKFLLDQMGMSSYLVWGWGTQLLAAIVLSLFISRRGYREILTVRPFKLLAAAGALRACSGFCFIAALVALDNIAVMSSLSGIKVILAAAFGLLFLGEGQFAVRKVFASVLAAAGVALIFW